MRNILFFSALIALFGGYLTKIYVWKTILGAHGILNSVLLYLHIIDKPIVAFLYNPVSIIIALTHYTLPLAILPIFGALAGVKDSPIKAAHDLGASSWRILREIIVPQVKRSVVFAFSLTYLFVAGDFVTQKLVGGSSVAMIGVLIQLQFGSIFDAPLGAALTFVMIGIGVIVISLFYIAISLYARIPNAR